MARNAAADSVATYPNGLYSDVITADPVEDNQYMKEKES